MCKSNCNSTPIALAPIVAHLQIQQIQPTVTSLAWWLVKIFTPFLYGYGHSFMFKLPVTRWWVGDGTGWVLKFEMSGLHLWYPHFFQNVVTKTWNDDLKPPKTIYNHLQPPQKIQQPPTTIYKHLKNIYNHLQTI